MKTYFVIRLCFNFSSDEDYYSKQILKTESPDEYFNTMMNYDDNYSLKKKGLKLDEEASNHPISYSIVKTNFDRYHPERNGDIEYVTYIRVKELKNE